MTNRIINIFLVFSLLICLAGCSQPADIKQDYKITVISEGGMPFKDVSVTIYKGTDRSDLVWRSETDSYGVVEFTAPESADYIAVLEDLPLGYDNKEHYPVEVLHILRQPAATV